MERKSRKKKEKALKRTLVMRSFAPSGTLSGIVYLQFRILSRVSSTD